MAIETTINKHNISENIHVNTLNLNNKNNNFKNKLHALHAENNNSLTVLSKSDKNKSQSSSIVFRQDGDSSSIDSDSDCEESSKNKAHIDIDFENTQNSEEIIIVNERQMTENMEQNSSYIKSNIGTIAVQNSSDITFGNKTFYQGPVTIKQFLLDSNWKDTDTGSYNVAYTHSDMNINKTNTLNKDDFGGS